MDSSMQSNIKTVLKVTCTYMYVCVWLQCSMTWTTVYMYIVHCIHISNTLMTVWSSSSNSWRSLIIFFYEPVITCIYCLIKNKFIMNYSKLHKIHKCIINYLHYYISCSQHLVTPLFSLVYSTCTYTCTVIYNSNK